MDPSEPESLRCPVRRPIVPLFLLPMLIAGGLIGVAVWIGWLSVRPMTIGRAIEQLRSTSGGERTAEVLVGPGAKERYLAAQAISLRIGELVEKGAGAGERAGLADALLDILQNHTRQGEGEIQHFLLLALGRVWQIDPRSGRGGADMSPAAAASRTKVVEAIAIGDGSGRTAYIDAPPVESQGAAGRRAAVEVRKAAVLALGFLAGNPELERAVPALLRTLADEQEDVDVRIAAASRLGAIARGDDAAAVEALIRAMRQSDAKDAEIAWNAALALAQMNRAEAEATILMLLDRGQLAQLSVYDRQADPDNPPRRGLTEEETERFLINAMLAAGRLTRCPAVQAKVRAIKHSDPSPRIRSAAAQVMASSPGAP